MTSDSDRSPTLLAWALTLGGVGFVCGFFGPIALDPDANQGPMLGLFITGPGGALFGLFAGLVAWVLPLTGHQRRRALAILCVVSFVAILGFCLPAAQRRARIVDAEVRGCEPPGPVADAATRDWESRIAAVTWSAPRPNWKRDVARMLGADPGVVLDVTIVRERDVYENRKPWNRGTRFATPWREPARSERFFARFAGATCERYTNLERQMYLPSSEVTAVWPPDRVPNYLGLEALDPVPPTYREFAVP